MLQTLLNVIKWTSVPVLLIGAVFSSSAASFELILDFVICLGSMIVVQRAVWIKEYFWAAGFLAIAVVFSPFPLAVKIFALMGLTCIAAFATVLAAWKSRPVPAA